MTGQSVQIGEFFFIYFFFFSIYFNNIFIRCWGSDGTVEGVKKAFLATYLPTYHRSVDGQQRDEVVCSGTERARTTRLL